MSALDDRVVDHLREVADLPDLTGTRYQILRRLDRGGMGTVYLVKDTALGRDVALKVLNAPDPDGATAARLVAEARHLARLEHPSIVPVHDVGELPDGRVYYAMKQVRGLRLDVWRLQEAQERLESSRPGMLRLFQRICEAVAFAHAAGVIHRDLKPENIMVGEFGEALVMDWGVAKLMGGAGGGNGARPPGTPLAPAGCDTDTMPAGVTTEGSVIGTPAWMSPEQARGETDRLDARTDVHALGGILYFLLSGRPPWHGATARDVMRQVAAGPPPDLRRDDPGIPRSLAAICAKAMAADPAGRYDSALQLSDDVARFLDGLPVLAHPESVLEKALRLLDRYRAIIWVIGAYVVMRLLVLIFTGR